MISDAFVRAAPRGVQPVTSMGCQSISSGLAQVQRVCTPLPLKVRIVTKYSETWVFSFFRVSSISLTARLSAAIGSSRMLELPSRSKMIGRGFAFCATML